MTVIEIDNGVYPRRCFRVFGIFLLSDYFLLSFLNFFLYLKTSWEFILEGDKLS